MVTFDKFSDSKERLLRRHSSAVFDKLGLDQSVKAILTYGGIDVEWGYIEEVPMVRVDCDGKLIRVTLYSLVLGNIDYLQADLCDLEEKLYAYMEHYGTFNLSAEQRKQQLEQATELACTAFWAKVRDCYPGITSGDFPPGNQDQFEQACKYAIETWREINE